MTVHQTVGNLVVKLMGDDTGFNKMLATAQKRTATFGRTMSMYVTAPLTMMGTMAVREFSKFDQAMTESTSIMKVTADQAQRMREQALELSKTSAQGPDEMARSYYFLASAGLNAEQAMKALPTVTAFATAGAFDMAKATELLTDAQSALGLKTSDATQNMINMTRVADTLTYAANASNASIEQFAVALTSKAASSMKMFNKDVEEGVAVLAAMADQGIKAELAGNSFTRIMTLLGKAAIDNAAAFKKYGFALYDGNGKMRNMADVIENLEKILNPMSDAMKTATLDALGFEARVQGAILPLLGTSAAIRKYEKELRAAGGATKDVAEKQMKSFSNQMGILWNNIKIAGIQLGEVLAPMIMKIGESVKGMTEWWSKLDDSTKTQIVRWGAFVALLGPAALALSKMIGLVQVLTSGMAFLATGTAAASASIMLLSGACVILLAVAANMIGKDLFGVTAFNAEVERSIALQAKLKAGMARQQDAVLTTARQGRGSGSDFGKAMQKSYIDDEVAKARQELAGYQQQMEMAQQELDRVNTTWKNLVGAKDLEAAQLRLQEVDAMFKQKLQFIKDLEAIIPEQEKSDAEAKNAEAAAKANALAEEEDALAKYVEKLKEEAATYGMTSAEAEIYKFKQKGLSAENLKAAQALSDQLNAMEKTKKAMEDGKAMTEEYLTPLEKLNKTRGELTDLLLVGAISDKTANRGIAAANKEYKEAEKALRELQMKARIQINFEFMNNSAVREGTAEFYKMMQGVVTATPKAPTVQEQRDADFMAWSTQALADEAKDPKMLHLLERIARGVEKPKESPIEVVTAGI